MTGIFQDAIVDVVKTVLRQEVSTLLCDSVRNSSALQRVPVAVDSAK